MFIEAKDDGGGGDNWSYMSCKAPVKSSPPTNRHPVFLQAGCPSYRPTNSVKPLKGKNNTKRPLAWGSKISGWISVKFSESVTYWTGKNCLISCRRVMWMVIRSNLCHCVLGLFWHLQRYVHLLGLRRIWFFQMRPGPDLLFQIGPGPDLADNPSVIAVSLCELGSIFVISHC